MDSDNRHHRDHCHWLVHVEQFIIESVSSDGSHNFNDNDAGCHEHHYRTGRDFYDNGYNSNDDHDDKFCNNDEIFDESIKIISLDCSRQ